ncbi:hypothetical protein L6164_035153 [Bauhinia variegata]|uniref:Uncharacterized protein n=1 Tax=Bauhinia variegata TaxID=167791 RepID=A0ACB9KX08_BAUVA|nr:hypothetical protein L6164_035153 [Bauhinia variegata]
MSDGALRVLDGTHLEAVDLSPPAPDASVTGAQILDVVHSRVSSCLSGLQLPKTLGASALARISTNDIDAFRSAVFDREKALEILRHYVAAIAHELKDDPLVVTVLDGSTLRLFLEDEDDFAMLAEDLFTDLDVEDKGKISKSKIRNALVQMGIEMGVPPFSEFPQLNDILSKHGVDGEEGLGQAQFAQLLQTVLQDLVDALFQKHVVLIQNTKVINGSKLRQLLINEKELDDIAEKILLEKNLGEDGPGSIDTIRSFLERNAKDLGLPHSEADEAVTLLYDDVFGDVVKENSDIELHKDELIHFSCANGGREGVSRIANHKNWIINVSPGPWETKIQIIDKNI